MIYENNDPYNQYIMDLITNAISKASKTTDLVVIDVHQAEDAEDILKILNAISIFNTEIENIAVKLHDIN